LSEGDGETLVRLVLRVAKEAGIKLMATKKTRVHFLNKPEFSLLSKWSVEE
jgi:N-acetylglutamate synthase-like GNAT family acetyltransferase